MRVARDTGEGQFLWPKGIDCIEEVPDELLRVVEHATTVLNWYDNLPSSDMPPRWMWHLPDQLDLHFKKVEESRGGGTSAPGEGSVTSLDQNVLASDKRWSRE